MYALDCLAGHPSFKAGEHFAFRFVWLLNYQHSLDVRSNCLLQSIESPFY